MDDSKRAAIKAMLNGERIQKEASEKPVDILDAVREVLLRKEAGPQSQGAYMTGPSGQTAVQRSKPGYREAPQAYQARLAKDKAAAEARKKRRAQLAAQQEAAQQSADERKAYQGAATGRGYTSRIETMSK